MQKKTIGKIYAHSGIFWELFINNLIGILLFFTFLDNFSVFLAFQNLYKRLGQREPYLWI